MMWCFPASQAAKHSPFISQIAELEAAADEMVALESRAEGAEAERDAAEEAMAAMTPRPGRPLPAAQVPEHLFLVIAMSRAVFRPVAHLPKTQPHTCLHACRCLRGCICALNGGSMSTDQCTQFTDVTCPMCRRCWAARGYRCCRAWCCTTGGHTTARNTLARATALLHLCILMRLVSCALFRAPHLVAKKGKSDE